jgi:predicted MFS family arabinose efflux permease
MRWRILALLSIARLPLGLQFQTLASTSEYLIADFSLSYTEIGTLIGLFMLPGMVLAIPVGFMGKRIADRWLSAFGLCLVAGGGIVAVMAEGYAQLAIARVICGAGFVFSTIYFTKMVADWFAGREIATALGILAMTWPLGIAVGQIAHEWLSQVMGWQYAFVLASALSAGGTFLVAVFYRPPAKVQDAVALPPSRIVRSELARILIASLVWAFFNAGYVVYLSFAPTLLTSSGIAPLAAAATISVASWVMIVSGAICGQVADRSGRPDTVLYICMAAAVISLVLLPNVEFAIFLSLMFGLVGMSPAGIVMSLSAQAMQPQNRALGMGIFFSSYFVIVAPAPVIAGWLFDLYADPYLPILLAALLFVLTVLSNLWFRSAQRT